MYIELLSTSPCVPCVQGSKKAAKSAGLPVRISEGAISKTAERLSRMEAGVPWQGKLKFVSAFLLLESLRLLVFLFVS